MPSLTDSDVVIRIVTAFENGGIEAAKKEAEALKKEIDITSTAGETLAGAMELLSSKGQDAGKVLGGLSDVLRGGIGSAGGFMKVVQGLGGALGMAAGPLSLLASGIGLAVNAWHEYKTAQEEAAEAARKAAEEQARAAEEAKKAAQEAADAATKAISEGISAAAGRARDKIKEITDGFNEATSASKALDDALSALADAQLGLELAQINQQIATASPEGKAQLEQQKVQLKAARENEKIQSEVDQASAQLLALDQGEYAAMQAKEQAATGISMKDLNAYTSARDTLAAGQKELEKVQEQIRTGEKKEGADAMQKSRVERWQAEFNAVAGSRGELGGLIGERAEAYLAAVQAESDLQAANVPQRQILQTQLQAAQIRQQTKAVETTTEASRIQREYEAQAATEKPVETPPEEPPAPTVSGLWRSASGQIQRGQEYKGQNYDIDNGKIQQQAREALANAGKAMAEGKASDDAKIISDLVAALEEMGARIADRNAMLRDLQQAVGLMRQQAKNARS